MSSGPTFKAFIPAIGIVVFLAIVCVVGLLLRGSAPGSEGAPSTALATVTLPAPTSTPAPTPTHVPIPTLVPIPPLLTVLERDGDGTGCDSNAGDYLPTFVVTNTGGETLFWSVATDDPAHISVTPATGSLVAGASSPLITLMGSYTVLTLSFTSNGGSQSFSLNCS